MLTSNINNNTNNTNHNTTKDEEDFGWGSDFDDQSLDSTLSSAAGSNHSGQSSSQDSGHSTQSAYSAAGSTNDENEERRNRFLQNRSIINSKLESIFKSHSGVQSHHQPPSASNHQDGDYPIDASIASSSSSSAGSSSNQSSPMSAKSLQFPIDLGTRKRLLEQQRLMSLKLKQKPRRKSVMRALNFNKLISDGQHSPPSNGSAGGGCGNSMTSADSQSPLNKSSSDPAGAPSNNNNHKMVRFAPAASTMTIYDDSMSTTSSLSFQANQPKATLSLGQLVKEVIDHCERPTLISRSVLNRSYSLSSDGLASPPGSPHLGGAYQHQSAQDISISTIGTIDGLEYSRVSESSDWLDNGGVNPLPLHQQLQQQQQKIGKQLKSSLGSYWKSLREFSQFKLPKVKLAVSSININNNNNNNNNDGRSFV